MNNRSGNNIQLSARHPTSVAPLKSPCFSVYHFNNGLLGHTKTVSRFLGGKRKSSSESMFHPITKQQITEARIAASMDKLSLEHTYSNDEEFPSSSERHQDEGFFEDNGVDMEGEQQLPQYKLAPDVKNGLEQMLNEILPQQIYKSVNESCMAVVPYIPPSELLLTRTLDIIKENDKQSKEINDVSSLCESEKISSVQRDELMHIDSVC